MSHSLTDEETLHILVKERARNRWLALATLTLFFAAFAVATVAMYLNP